jgi:hypothetical protein
MNLVIIPNFKKDYVGGPATFSRRLKDYLEFSGASAGGLLGSCTPAVLIINASRDYLTILVALLKRIPIYTRVGSIYRSNIFEDTTAKAKLRYALSLARICLNVLLSRGVIYQSETIKHEWDQLFFARRKKFRIIYNPKPRCFPQGGSSGDLAEISKVQNQLAAGSAPSSVLILAYEANHPTPDRALPYLVYRELIKQGVAAQLAVFGHFNEAWKEKANEHNGIVLGGMLDFFYSIKELGNLRPIFVGSDLVPAGCPNSVIEMMSIGVPILCYQNTATQEIADSAGLFVDAHKSDLLKGKFPNLGGFVSAALKLRESYADYSARALQRSNLFSEENTLAKYVEFITATRVNK